VANDGAVLQHRAQRRRILRLTSSSRRRFYDEVAVRERFKACRRPDPPPRRLAVVPLIACRATWRAMLPLMVAYAGPDAFPPRGR